MNPRHSLIALATALALGASASALAEKPTVGTSPWGPADEIGRLNTMSAAARAKLFARLDARIVYDLGVEYFVGMPSWQAVGDPEFQLWMTHTPHGTAVDDPLGVGAAENAHVSYTGSAVSMYTHTGTHIDALNHFGLDGKIWNGFAASEHLGDRGWRKTGAETIPPIVARGVLIDVAASKGVDELPAGYRVRAADLRTALERQGVELRAGDVVLVRTGRMRAYENAAAYMQDSPGLALDGARFLVEEGGAMVLGADNLSFETFPSEIEGNYIPVHTYLLAQQGAFILELVELEALARDRVYEFAFIAASLKFRGADAAPLRPIAIPLLPARNGGR
jgi:kynurenine formamidase